jgi:hypothetical protein
MGAVFNMETKQNLLILPTADNKDLSFNLEELAKIESRKKEISYVNKETAPELLHIFNEGFLEVSKISTRILQEYEKMTLKVKERRAQVILDLAPEELKKRNLVTSRSPSGSEDQRQAILDLDKQYQELVEKSNALKAAYNYFKIRAKSLEMAYQAVKKVIDPNSNNSYSGYLSTTPDIEEPVGNEVAVGEPKFYY